MAASSRRHQIYFFHWLPAMMEWKSRWSITILFLMIPRCYCNIILYHTISSYVTLNHTISYYILYPQGIFGLKSPKLGFPIPSVSHFKLHTLFSWCITTWRVKPISGAPTETLGTFLPNFLGPSWCVFLKPGMIQSCQPCPITLLLQELNFRPVKKRTMRKTCNLHGGQIMVCAFGLGSPVDIHVDALV